MSTVNKSPEEEAKAQLQKLIYTYGMGRLARCFGEAIEKVADRDLQGGEDIELVRLWRHNAYKIIKMTWEMNNEDCK